MLLDTKVEHSLGSSFVADLNGPYPVAAET